MSKEFITIDQATNKLQGITTTGGNEYISKQNILLLGADPNLLTGYANTDFVAYDDVNKKKKMDNMRVFNNSLYGRDVYSRIGVVADPNDKRIPFVYASAIFDFKNITFGVVVNGTIITTSISLANATEYWYSVATTALSGNYLFCCAGSSNDANTQYKIYKLDTSNNTLNAIATYTGSNFKFPRSFSFVEKIGNYHYAYFDVSGTYRYICRLEVNEINDSCSYTKGKDISPIMYSQVLTKESNGNYATFAMTENKQAYIMVSSTWDYHSSLIKNIPISYTPMTEFFIRCLIYRSSKCISVGSTADLKSTCLYEIYTGEIVKDFGYVGIHPELVNYDEGIWWTELNSSGNTYESIV